MNLTMWSVERKAWSMFYNTLRFTRCALRLIRREFFTRRQDNETAGIVECQKQEGGK